MRLRITDIFYGQHNNCAFYCIRQEHFFKTLSSIRGQESAAERQVPAGTRSMGNASLSQSSQIPDKCASQTVFAIHEMPASIPLQNAVART